MLSQQIGVVSEVAGIGFGEVAIVAAALQKQATRDVGPLWGVESSVSAFATLEDLPLGYWPVILRDDIGFSGAAGIHLDKDGQPFALVQSSTSWPMTASHEVCEMLCDPFGNRLVSGDSVHPDQGRVEYLVEVCDPSEAAEFGYRVNGVLVSDFYTPNFFDPVVAAGKQYSFSGALTAPRQVLKGGYLSWHDPESDHWWQQRWFSGAAPTFQDLGIFTAGTESLRSEIDRRTPRPNYLKGLPANAAPLTAAAAARVDIVRAATSKAKTWHDQIVALREKYRP